MSDVSLSVLITRFGLSPPLNSLELNDDPYTIGAEMDIGKVTQRRITAESPFVDGEFLTQVTKGQSQGTLQVWVSGSTILQVRANIESLVTAFSQFEYTITTTTDNAVWSYRCEPADYAVGFENVYLSAKYVPVALSFYRYPVPVQGPI